MATTTAPMVITAAEPRPRPSWTRDSPGWIVGTGQWRGINWQQVTLTDLSARKGHQIRIRVVGADCTQGGHGGYAYLDGVNCN